MSVKKQIVGKKITTELCSKISNKPTQCTRKHSYILWLTCEHASPDDSMSHDWSQLQPEVPYLSNRMSDRNGPGAFYDCLPLPYGHDQSPNPYNRSFEICTQTIDTQVWLDFNLLWSSCRRHLPKVGMNAIIRSEIAFCTINPWITFHRIGRQMFEDPMRDTISAIVR